MKRIFILVIAVICLLSLTGCGKKTEEELKIDKKQIVRFFEIDNKEDILKLLGNDYKIVQVGAEGLIDGYSYDKLGIIFAFSEDGKLDWIEGEKLYSVFNVKAEMSLKQVEERLGTGTKGKAFIETPDHPIDTLDYKMDNYYLSFYSFEGEEQGVVLTCYTVRFYKKD